MVLFCFLCVLMRIKCRVRMGIKYNDSSFCICWVSSRFRGSFCLFCFVGEKIEVGIGDGLVGRG